MRNLIKIKCEQTEWPAEWTDKASNKFNQEEQRNANVGKSKYAHTGILKEYLF